MSSVAHPHPHPHPHPWSCALPHRPQDDPATKRLRRFTTPEVVAEVLADHGAGLLAQVQGQATQRDWIGACGGTLGAVLVLAEVDAAASALRSAVAAARARVLSELVLDHSLVELAGVLGVTRQALHKSLRGVRGL